MLAVTFWLWDHERQSSQKELRAQFEFALRDTVSRIDQRESAYEQMLRGVQGLLAATDSFAPKAFHDYVDTLRLDANFSGIQGLGVIQWVPNDQKSTHINTMRRWGRSSYMLLPDGDRDNYAPIIEVTPNTASFQKTIGFDSWFDLARKKAMEKARDSGSPAITEKLQLAVDKAKRSAPPAFIMYLPIYSRDKPLDSVAQRREALIGWVYASFHMEDFMASLYGKQVDGLSLSIYDGVAPSRTSLMYELASITNNALTTSHPALSVREYIVVAGHTWTLSLSTRNEFESRFRKNSDWLIASIGVCFSLSMALLVWYMLAGRAHALRLAEAITIELRHMAQHDLLTGLPNRALFSDRVQQKLADAKRRGNHAALCFIDLDKFKPINDNYGHAVGDILLQQVAQRLGESVRTSDTVGRIGGDEFVVLLGDLSSADIAQSVADKIRLSIAKPFSVNDLNLTISCSIGIATYPEDGEDEATLTKSADKAMYRVKRGGVTEGNTLRANSSEVC